MAGFLEAACCVASIRWCWRKVCVQLQVDVYHGVMGIIDYIAKTQLLSTCYDVGLGWAVALGNADDLRSSVMEGGPIQNRTGAHMET